MKIIRAQHLGMCFGVRDAVALAEESVRERPVTVLGQLVHNQTVLDRLAKQGVRFADHPESVETSDVIITAHGASERRKKKAVDAGLRLIDSTCPLVAHAHRAIHMLVAQGFHPIVIGRPGHVEVNGMTEDLSECDIIQTAADLDTLRSRPRFGVCAQTTQPIDRVLALVDQLRKRFPESEVKFLDTVCQPTKQRQSAAINLAGQVDVVVVVGGPNSNNTRELRETCRLHCARVHQVQSGKEICDEWFHPEDTVGITAGTSTPDETINQVEQAIWSSNEPAHFVMQSKNITREGACEESVPLAV
ncbi:MAG: 4-hydroxy-3-methylbut-2-enyl diphosphate reductase [Verrucomicrobiia bacterium]|jgi:4-hydroxy-3-methylbut-2-enyl diphosphate reductase